MNATARCNETIIAQHYAETPMRWLFTLKFNMNTNGISKIITTGTIGNGHNIYCTASPILANRSTVRKDWKLNCHPGGEGDFGKEHPHWKIQGLFTAHESYGRWPSGLAEFEIDAQEDDKSENFIGDHSNQYRRMALNGLCIAGNGVETNEDLTDTLTEISWEEARNVEKEYIWNAETGEWDLDDYIDDRLNNLDSWSYFKENEFDLDGYDIHWSAYAPEKEDNPWEEYSGGEMAERFYQGSQKYQDDPNYKWDKVFEEWVFVQRGSIVLKPSQQVKRWYRGNHDEFKRTFCDASKSKCACEDQIRRNREGNSTMYSLSGLGARANHYSGSRGFTAMN